MEGYRLSRPISEQEEIWEIKASHRQSSPHTNMEMMLPRESGGRSLLTARPVLFL